MPLLDFIRVLSWDHQCAIFHFQLWGRPAPPSVVGAPAVAPLQSAAYVQSFVTRDAFLCAMVGLCGMTINCVLTDYYILPCYSVVVARHLPPGYLTMPTRTCAIMSFLVRDESDPKPPTPASATISRASSSRESICHTAVSCCWSSCTPGVVVELAQS